MKRLLIWVFGLVFVAVLALAVLVVLYGDQRYHTVLLAPIADNGWYVPPSLCGKTCAHESDRYCKGDATGQILCWLYPHDYPTPWVVRYEDKGARISVSATDLNWPDDSRSGVWDSSAEVSLDGKVLFQVMVWAKSPATQIDLSRILGVEPCGPGVAKLKAGAIPLRYVAYKWFRGLPGSVASAEPFPPNYHYGALLMQAEASKIRECTLSFRNAVKSATGRTIPDVRLHVVPVAYYRGLT